MDNVREVCYFNYTQSSIFICNLFLGSSIGTIEFRSYCEGRIRRNVERSLFTGTIPAFTWRDWGKPWTFTVNIAGLQVDIRTWDIRYKNAGDNQSTATFGEITRGSHWAWSGRVSRKNTCSPCRLITLCSTEQVLRKQMPVALICITLRYSLD